MTLSLLPRGAAFKLNGATLASSFLVNSQAAPRWIGHRHLSAPSPSLPTPPHRRQTESATSLRVHAACAPPCRARETASPSSPDMLAHSLCAAAFARDGLRPAD